VVDYGFGLFADDRPGGFRDGFFRRTAFGGWHKNTPCMLTMTHGPLGVRRLRAMMYQGGSGSALRPSGPGLFLHGFHLSFAADAVVCDGPRLQAFDGNVFSAGLADAVHSLFDVFQGFADFLDQHAFAVTDPQGEVALGVENGTVQRIRKVFVDFPQAGHRAVGVARQFLEIFKVFVFHGAISRRVILVESSTGSITHHQRPGPRFLYSLTQKFYQDFSATGPL
jgi:hypothetical protein